METGFSKTSKSLPELGTRLKSNLEMDLIQGESRRREFASLLKRSFNVPVDRDFFQDFPIWDERVCPSSDSLIRFGVFVKKDSTLVASAGVRVAQLKTMGKNLRVALIGAVATDPKYRGHGLATQLVKMALQWSRDRGAAAVFLWGSEHSLYRKLGFDLCGSQQLVSLKDLVKGDHSEPTALKKGWAPRIFRLMQNRPLGLVLGPADERWISAHSKNNNESNKRSETFGLQWYYTGTSENPTAYAAVGRGIDLEGMVHEWGGEPRSLRGLFARLAKLSDGLRVLGSQETLSAVGFDTSHFQTEFHCLARVLDPAAVVTAFQPDINLEDSEISRLISASENELPNLLFGPQNTKSKMKSLSLPLWFWGLDAV